MELRDLKRKLTESSLSSARSKALPPVIAPATAISLRPSRGPIVLESRIARGSVCMI